MTNAQHERLHSAEWFGPERDYLWNLDYLELIARRFELGSVRSVLDVGCGIGHWTRLFGLILPSDAQVVGIDREQEWINQAQAIAEQRGLLTRLRFERGVAEHLDFDDDSFDLVTCQTLLIHVESPAAVIKEMLRVTRPGGLILAAEPNNRAQFVIDTSLETDAPIEALIDRMRFVLTCERGKRALGEGYGSVGDLVPGYLAEQGALDIKTFIADRPENTLIPPYETDDQQARRLHALRELEQNKWVWAREDALRYFMAGGGTREQFDAAWPRRLDDTRRKAEAITDGTLHTAGGSIHYLIVARKPT